MQVFPSKKSALLRLVKVLVMMVGFTMVGGIILGYRYYQLTFNRPSEPVAVDYLAYNQPPCRQRMDKTGYQLRGNELSVYPHCLTVMNSKFGARFNVDVLLGSSQINSSVLGTLEDREAGVMLIADDQQIFPQAPNNSFNQLSVDLGLTYETLNYQHEDQGISLTVTSPFEPSQQFDSESTQMSTAPFMYVTVKLTNTGSEVERRTVDLSWGRFKKRVVKKDYDVLYLVDETRKDGQRALIVPHRSGLITYQQGDRTGLKWETELAPKVNQEITLIYAGYVDGAVMTDTANPQALVRYQFAYTKWFKTIEEVIDYAISHQHQLRQRTNAFEQTVKNKTSDPKYYWLLAQAFHSYLGNSWLVVKETDPNQFAYYVWEGEFKFINTVDVAHEYAVLEGLYFPWAMKSELMNWMMSKKVDGMGTVIPHDIGKRFEITQHQTYGNEQMQPSAMPVEENANFLLLLSWYHYRTGDSPLIKLMTPLAKELVASMIARDSNQNGMADQQIGITTYDNFDNIALLKAPDNVYLAVKQLGAYMAVQPLINDPLLELEISKLMQTLEQEYQAQGKLPLAMDGSSQYGFPIVMGLLYPTLMQIDHPALPRLKEMLGKSLDQSWSKRRMMLLTQNEAQKLGWWSHAASAAMLSPKLGGKEIDWVTPMFDILYDSPYGYTDGVWWNEDGRIESTPLVFYPRGGVLFSGLAF